MSTSSVAFELFHPRVQQWIWKAEWKDLRDIQEKAARPMLEGASDVLLASATASGKTEAVFLPLATLLAENERQPGVDVLYISPLKALINDQDTRITSIMEAIDVPVHRWHGDVAHSKKRKVVKEPEGVLLITPESLEALFVRRGDQVSRLFADLTAVVVDELHAYIGTERGRQLQSLLHRIELCLDRRVRRVAMSATLGDMVTAADFLRPGESGQVVLVQSDAVGQEVRLQIRGYLHKPSAIEHKEAEVVSSGGEVSLEDEISGDVIEISEHLYATLRGGRHLVFANRRADVELYSDLLRRASERYGVPNEFLPHHGSLDRTLREEAEDRLRESPGPATVIATTTLELGIDIGAVESIAQVGPPWSVMSMRQRLGRSGRRGDPAVLRIYVQEPAIDERTPPHDQLRSSIVQAIAMVRLLVERWYEPPPHGALHLSTLVQQVLSSIAQKGGIRAVETWRELCSSGPFRAVDRDAFARFLRCLAHHDLVVQTHDGEIVLGLMGERLVNDYEFYAAFVAGEEYRVVTGSKTLGSLPIHVPLIPGRYMIFGGRRWRIESVDDEKRIVYVLAASGGRPPLFGGTGAMIHDRVREEMRRVYQDNEIPPFVDARGRGLLIEGRETFRRFALDRGHLVDWGKSVVLFPWVGDRALHTLALWLGHWGLDASPEGEAVLIEKTSEEEVVATLEALVSEDAPSDVELARGVSNKVIEKHHRFLDEELLTTDYASSHLDIKGAVRAVRAMVGASD